MTALLERNREVQSLRLGEEVEHLSRAEALRRRGRNARVVLQTGELRVLLVALGAGATMPEHSVPGGALVQVLSGKVVLRSGERVWLLEAGRLLSLAPGFPHSVETTEGCVILVTIHGGGELRHLFEAGENEADQNQE